MMMMTLKQAPQEILRRDFDTLPTELPTMSHGGRGVIASAVLPEIVRVREPGEDG